MSSLFLLLRENTGLIPECCIKKSRRAWEFVRKLEREVHVA